MAPPRSPLKRGLLVNEPALSFHHANEVAELARKVTADKMLEALKGEGGTVLKTSLDHTKEAALQTALAGVQAGRSCFALVSMTSANQGLNSRFLRADPISRCG
jgi:hypothetical protein